MSAPTRLHVARARSRSSRFASGPLSPVIDRGALPNFARIETFKLNDPADRIVTIATTDEVWSLVVEWDSSNLLVDSEDERLIRLVDAAVRAVRCRPNAACGFTLDYNPSHLNNEVGRRSVALTATMRRTSGEEFLITITRDA